MTKKEFMQKLDELLSNLPYSDKIEVFNYYEEYFSDLELKDSDEVPNNMSPNEIAKEILLEYNLNINKNKNKQNKKSKESFSTLILILGAIFSAPITIPILLVVLSLILTVIIFIFTFGISTVAIICSVLFIPLKVFGNILFGFGNRLSIVSLIGICLITAGILLGFYSIIINILKLIIYILSTIVFKIYSLITRKESKEDKYTGYMNDLKKVIIRDFPGKIKIIKSNINEYTIKNSSSIVMQPTFENGVFSLSTKSKYYTHLSNVELIILYNSNELDLNIKNVLGKIDIETAKKSDIYIKNVLGKININIPKNESIDIRSSEILGKLNIEPNISVSTNCDIKMEVMDIIGSIYVKEVI